jgi:predicted lipoprotein with Yx(FWY)xxD motif
MKHSMNLLTTLVVTAIVAAAAAAIALAGGTTGAGTKVAIGKTGVGRILVDSKGISLYDFPPDKGTTSVCYGACAALWPPVLTHGKPVAGPGVRASLLGTTKRKDGKLEVTYNGHPLYYWVGDHKPGQTTGQGLNQFGGPWWVLSPAGKEIHRG